MEFSRSIKILIMLALILGLIFLSASFGKEFISALLPLIIGIIITYLLLPIIDCFEKRSISRTLSIILSMLLIIIIISVMLKWIIPIMGENITELAKVIPEIFDSVYQNLLDIIEKNLHSDLYEKIKIEINNGFLILQQKTIAGLYSLVTLIPKTITAIIDVLVGLIISFYILKDKELLIENFKRIFPKKYSEEIICFLRDIHRVVLKFIQGQILIAIIIGIIETIGLYIIGMPYAILLGFLGGISNIIPYFGPYIGAIPAVVIALTISPVKAILVISVFVVVQQLDNIILSPKVIKGKLGLHPIITIMSVLVGGRLFGFFGLVFAVPVVAMIRIIVKKVYRMVSG
ncbi:MAG TPA: AI-2E family transporter [Thermoclostridium sp.]|nr:AI-2E family transporter [Thermoclostridium sp.]